MAEKKKARELWNAAMDKFYQSTVEHLNYDDAGEGLLDVREVTMPVHQWWVVSNSTDTGMVITDETRCIITAPVVWNKFIGMELSVLLERMRATAVKVPGPAGKPAC